MKIYKGSILKYKITGDENDRFKVTVNGNYLKEYQNIINHSPDGFCWGYAGSGPSQLALAIMIDLYGEFFAKDHYQTFKSDIIERLNIDNDFTLTEEQIETWKKSRNLETLKCKGCKKDISQWDSIIEENERYCIKCFDDIVIPRKMQMK